MSISKPACRVHYLNVPPSDALSAQIEHGVALLDPFRARIARCDVHVGRWMQHHGSGTSYRVTLELEPESGALPVSIECESAPNPSPSRLFELVGEAFARAATRLAARAQYAASEAEVGLSPDARRLHPLHGLAPEEVQFGANDD